MGERTEIIREMEATALPGQLELDQETLSRLTKLTSRLMGVTDEAVEEYCRFQQIQDRLLGFADHRLAHWFGGKTVLVTGGTGCIGSFLLSIIAQHQPSRLISVSRGVTPNNRPIPKVEYIHVDVRDQGSLNSLFEHVRPNVVFHLAAQRDPGLAEREVLRTITTNIFGTRNVVAACESNHVKELVYASTGKAFRLYSKEIYTTTKIAGEWLVSSASLRGKVLCSAARFTHVANNSLILNKIVEFSSTGPIRLHAPEIGFFAQSAAESAELLLCSGIGTSERMMMNHAIRDLGWPIDLLRMTLGYLHISRRISPIYFCGFEPGYEDSGYRGLWDPKVNGDVSPLINAFEARTVRPSVCVAVDSFPVIIADASVAEKDLDELWLACQDNAQSAIQALDRLARGLLDGALGVIPRVHLKRAASLMSEIPCITHKIIDDRIRCWLDSGRYL